MAGHLIRCTGVCIRIWLAPRSQLRGAAHRLRTRSIARSNARTIVTCSKRCATARFSPPDVGARKTRRRYSADYVFARQPDPTPTPKDLEKQGSNFADLVSQGRGRQSRTVYRCTQRYCGMAALGRAAQRTDVGGLWCLRARTFVRRAQSRGLQTEHRGFCRGRSIGHVRYFVSRRV